MTKEEFIAKLQMVYFGDRNVFNELVSAYNDLQKRIDKAIEYNTIISNSDYVYSQDEVANKNLSILQGEEVK